VDPLCRGGRSGMNLLSTPIADRIDCLKTSNGATIGPAIRFISHLYPCACVSPLPLPRPIVAEPSRASASSMRASMHPHPSSMHACIEPCIEWISPAKSITSITHHPFRSPFQ
jgi:hypothetical protein